MTQSGPTDSHRLSHPKSGMSFWALIGLSLMLLSGVFFFALLAIPWMPVSGGSRVILAGILFGCVQVSWWVGAALAGPALIGKIRARFSRAKTGSGGPG